MEAGKAKKLPAGYAPLMTSLDFTAWAKSKAGKEIIAALS